MKNYSEGWNLSFQIATKDLNNLDLCLEIGCFEGLTSKYIVEKLLTENGILICVDPLTDNYLNDNLNEKDVENNKTIYKYFESQYDRFVSNCNHELQNERIKLLRDLSSNVYPTLIEDLKGMFDLIYIDGDHRADAVYLDAINCFELCKNGGHILFDDYSWGGEYGTNAPSIGIDRFLSEYEGKYQIITKSYQVMIKKNDTII